MLLKLLLPYFTRAVSGGLVVHWHKAEGDSVEYGDDLFDMKVEEVKGIRNPMGSKEMIQVMTGPRVAERMLRVYQDAILMPYAVEVDSQVITLYDPVVHKRIEVEDEEFDPRWILCKRPYIMVGGEREIFEQALPVLQSMGKKENIFHVGSNGVGEIVKIVAVPDRLVNIVVK